MFRDYIPSYLVPPFLPILAVLAGIAMALYTISQDANLLAALAFMIPFCYHTLRGVGAFWPTPVFGRPRTLLWHVLDFLLYVPLLIAWFVLVFDGAEAVFPWAAGVVALFEESVGPNAPLWVQSGAVIVTLCGVVEGWHRAKAWLVMQAEAVKRLQSS